MTRNLGALFVLLCASFAHASTIDVEGPQDSLAGPPTINHCTLRKAVITANLNNLGYPQCVAGSPGLDTITLPAGMLFTFTLAGNNDDAALTGDLDVTEDLIIQGNGAIIDGADLDRIFHVHPGVTLTIYDLHIRNGRGNGGGGGLTAVNATVNLHNVTISGCEGPNGDGGAISIDGTLNMTNCTISGNTAAHYAGGVILAGGTANVSSCTITGNSSGFSNLTGGYHSSGTTTIRNSVIAGNTGLDLPNVAGFFVSAGHNIIGSLGTNAPAFTMTATTGDQVGVVDANLNFGPLQYNGGLTPTHALNAGSIALDAGNSGGLTTDQRGLTRPCDNASLSNAAGSDGADVGAFEEQVICASPAAPPVATDDVATVAEDSGPNVVNVLTNDTDTDPLTIVSVTQPSNGVVTFTASTVAYAPAPNFFGTDSFTYTISDGTDTDTATVTVTVTNVNDAPVAAGETYTINQDTTLTVAAPGVLANDSDIDGPSLSAVGMSVNADGSFTYTPPAGFTGTVTFTYVASDGIDSSAPATVTIHVLDTAPPVITASTAVTSLWPPNGKLTDVGLTFSATDNGGTATTSVAVYSDEDDGATLDAVGLLQLRAERAGTGDGRFYLIVITATDASSNTSKTCLTVTVPKSQSAADVASVNAQAAAAQSQCTGAGLFVVGS